MTGAREPLIEVRGLRSQFGDNVIHDDLDLTVARGEVIGVVGGSGTGKTVLLNTIIGLKEPEGASVSIFGHDMANLSGPEAADVHRNRSSPGGELQAVADEIGEDLFEAKCVADE
ncbi:MAG: ATP-binding cassette domain-containing protein, partial [Alphaproteobacteria bacterium]|nr:ATP-binding cassette domain-containing protein [Alphaproteobacteria bacterium]